MPPGIDPRRAEIAERIARQHGETRVVLSFGARGGGAYFARWLRWQIMQRRGYSKPNHVYLDTEALRLVPETQVEVLDNSRPWMTGVASLNNGWHDYYRYAMTRAHTMIFVVTPEWVQSSWCQKEARDYQRENRDRAREKRPRLKGISLVFGEALPTVGQTQAVRATKQDVDGGAPGRAAPVRANPAAGEAFGVRMREAKIPPNPGWGGLFTMDGRSLLRLMNLVGRP